MRLSMNVRRRATDSMSITAKILEYGVAGGRPGAPPKAETIEEAEFDDP